MRFTPDNFLYLVKQLITGKNGDSTPNGGTADAADGGIKVERDARFVAATAALIDSTTGTPSTTNTLVDVTVTPTQAAINANFATVARAINSLAVLGSTFPAGAAVVLGSVRFIVPRDYDETSDHLRLEVFISTAVADAGVFLTGTATVRSLGASPVVHPTVAGTAQFSPAITIIGPTEQLVVINLSGYGLIRNDIVTVALALVGTTTGVTTVYGVETEYDSTIVSFNETDATGIDSAYVGNPLR